MYQQPKARVVLLIETARVFGRELLRGIARYSHEHGPWSFHISPGTFEQAIPKMKQWGATGIIARIPNEKVAEHVLRAGLPTIGIGMRYLQRDSEGIPDIYPIEADLVKFAADHFLEKAFRHFAYVGSCDRGWSAQRETAYRDYLSSQGIEPSVYVSPAKPQDRLWEREQSILAKWMSGLPTPVGVLACDDDRGREVLEACAIAGLKVPDDVAVLGVDNDDVFCELSDPPLSSVSLNTRAAGYRAAELLDGLMSGQIKNPPHITVEALGVVPRRSSEIVAIEDDEISAALEIIHKNQGRDVSVESLVEELAVSRRSLEKRFRALLGRSILEEVQLAKLNYAKRLLQETPYSVARVAKQSGFGTTGYFIQFFQRRIGKTPGKYRADLLP
jgi:LacI family transcriptional regulator